MPSWQSTLDLSTDSGQPITMDESKNLAESGEWWLEPWWNRPDRQVYCEYSKEHLAQSAEVLKRHFDAKWTSELASNPRRNIVFPALCIGGSTSALSLVGYLGEMIGALEGSPGFHRAIVDLKGDKGESALLELEAAYAFALAGHGVCFPAEGNNKSPDIIANLGNTAVAIECKRLRAEAWEEWEETLTTALITALPWMKGERQISVNVALNTRLTHICVGENEKGLNAAFLNAIVREVVDVTTDAVSASELPIDVTIPEIARIRVTYRDQGEFGGVSGMERTSAPITRRILQNGVMRACEQFPAGTPGIAVVYSKLLPNSQFFQLFFETACRAQEERFSSLVAVLLCSMQTIVRASTPIILGNPYSRFPAVREEVVKVLASKFPAVLVEPR